MLWFRQKRWSTRWLLLIGRIELTVGRDLQYIRFNGALIGGLAGLALHALEQGAKLWL